MELREGIQFKDNPSLLLEIFLLFQKHKNIQGIDSKTISMITENLHLIDDSFRENKENKKLFLDILKAPEGVTHELKRMNLYGVLGHYIPAFGKIEGRMQYDLFHAFTIDEHTLLVVSNLRRLALKRFDHEYMEYSKKMQSIANPEILYIAGLFHDIAKGRNEDHSILGSLEAESFCLDHGMSKYESKLVSWLVENHLMLSLTAQRKDINDPNVIRSFAIKVGDESRLDYLYLLTICDVRATNPNLWSTWKRQLFDELYLLTKKALREGLENPIDKDELIAEKKYLVEGKLNDNQGKKGLVSLFSFLGESYFLKFKDQEIVHHSKIMMEKKFLENPEIIVNLQQNIIEEQTCVFIICQTQSNAFLTATGIFEQINLTIHDAKVMELNNGYSIYNFYIQEMNGVAIEDKKKIQQIKSRIENALRLEDDSSPIVNRKLSRRLRYFDTKTSINFTEDNISNRTVMELISIDRPGLLFDIAKTLKTENVWIESAKIATIGERVEDIFYLTTQNKMRLSKSNCEQLEKNLEKSINQS
jgi:[protein-PII] uridylyltransferase